MANFNIQKEGKDMKITLVSNNTFSLFGGYEKVISTVLKNLEEKYDCNILKIISVPHYLTLLNNHVLDDFKQYQIHRDSDYKNKIHYISFILLRKFLGKDLLINYNSLKKQVDTLINSDVILVTDPLLISSVKAVLQGKSYKTKIVYWDHGSLMGYFRGKYQRLVYGREIAESIRSADAHLCISSEIAELIKNIDSKAKVYTVYNPVPSYYGPLVKRSSYPIFLYVGRLNEHHKNISFLLKGLSHLRYKDWKLIVIGTGPDESKLKKLASDLGISDKIQWLGFKKDPYSEIKEATALLLTSRWEGFPMVLVEANQRGIPIISSDCKAGPKDIVINGVNGYLYKEGDMGDFVSIITSIIDGKLNFESPENIAKTTERFNEELVISNIYNSLIQVVKEG